MKVSPAVARTEVAIAFRVWRTKIFPERGIFHIEFSDRSEKLAVSPVASRQDAVKLIYPPLNRLPQILRRSHPHEIARLIDRQKFCRQNDHLHRCGARLPE